MESAPPVVLLVAWWSHTCTLTSMHDNPVTNLEFSNVCPGVYIIIRIMLGHLVGVYTPAYSSVKFLELHGLSILSAAPFLYVQGAEIHA